MANPYLDLYKAEGTKQFSASGFIARLPIAMISIGVIAMLNALGYSYGNAGYVAAAYVLSNAVISPQLSRFADQYGQRRAIIIGTTIASLSLLALIVAALNQAALGWLILFAVFTGFMPSFGAFVRARWSAIYSHSPKLKLAFAAESILDELIFMLGPIITLSLTTIVVPAAGPLAALLFLIAGSLLFLSQKKSEPVARKLPKEEQGSVIRLPQVMVIALIMVAIGGIFGTIEISVLAFAKELNLAVFASLPLIAYAAGSFIAGIIYGALPVRMPLSHQLLVSTAIAAATVLPLFWATNLWVLSVILLFAGAACSPTVIITMALIEQIVPNKKLNEGMSWAITGLSIGVSLGAAITGQIIDKMGAATGFNIAILSGVSAFIFALLSRNLLNITSKMKEYSLN